MSLQRLHGWALMSWGQVQLTCPLTHSLVTCGGPFLPMDGPGAQISGAAAAAPRANPFQPSVLLRSSGFASALQAAGPVNLPPPPPSPSLLSLAASPVIPVALSTSPLHACHEPRPATPGDVVARVPMQGCPRTVAQNPGAELDYWTDFLATRPQDMSAWLALPLYSQYVGTSSLSDIAEECLRGLKAKQTERRLAEQAADLPVELAKCAFFPVAVMAQFAAKKSGKPALFVVDFFLACLARCLHQDFVVLPYPEGDPTFTVRPRFWSCPVGDPAARKSPTFSWLKGLFDAFQEQCPEHFPWQSCGVSHVYQRGSHAGLNEVFRRTRGVALIATPQPVATSTLASLPSCNATRKRS